MWVACTEEDFKWKFEIFIGIDFHVHNVLLIEYFTTVAHAIIDVQHSMYRYVQYYIERQFVFAQCKFLLLYSSKICIAQCQYVHCQQYYYAHSSTVGNVCIDTQQQIVEYHSTDCAVCTNSGTTTILVQNGDSCWRKLYYSSVVYFASTAQIVLQNCSKICVAKQIFYTVLYNTEMKISISLSVWYGTV